LGGLRLIRPGWCVSRVPPGIGRVRVCCDRRPRPAPGPASISSPPLISPRPREPRWASRRVSVQAARSASTNSATPSITMVGRARSNPSGRVRTTTPGRQEEPGARDAARNPGGRTTAAEVGPTCWTTETNPSHTVCPGGAPTAHMTPRKLSDARGHSTRHWWGVLMRDPSCGRHVRAEPLARPTRPIPTSVGSISLRVSP